MDYEYENDETLELNENDEAQNAAAQDAADEVAQNLAVVDESFPENLIILPSDDRPVFPGIAAPLSFSDPAAIEAVTTAVKSRSGYIGMALQRKRAEGEVVAADYYEVGSLLKIFRVMQRSKNSLQALAQSTVRFKRKDIISTTPFKEWKVEYYREPKVKPTDELKPYLMAIISEVKELLKLNPMFKEQLNMVVAQVDFEKPGLMMDIVASLLSASGEKLQELLETYDLFERAERLLLLIREEIELARIQQKITEEINEKVSARQKEYMLREQLKAIKRELGIEKDEKTTDVEKFQKRLENLTLTEEAQKVFDEELEKLQTLEPTSPEMNVTRSYLDVLTDLPWGVYSKDRSDIRKARRILNADHYGLDDVKENILEFLSGIVKRGKLSGTILCLVGPPGVGKTSIGKSIAAALGRKFFRFSLGGMRDEAEIKGHRRTYIGAMPGKFIQSIRRAKTANPVIMLDEIDKIGTSFQGDPASALLEALDPEQNQEFLDHYLDVHFDLSNVLFVGTANQLDTIPAPLLDRMEVIRLAGYIMSEKVEIARRHLVPKQLREQGFSDNELRFTPGALQHIVEHYAREAGVRNLEKQIRKILRKLALKQAEGTTPEAKITKTNVEKYLGKPFYTTEELYNKRIPGVALGLAYTSTGGATLYVEATAIEGKNAGFKQTGQLGDVMRESSEIAYSYVRSKICKRSECRAFFENNLVHIHVPAGATPKDGPSAGITMALALYSLATNTPVNDALAMTGELTLTGKVLPIGGVREKTIAAKRVGIRELILPIANKRDFDELPAHIRDGMTIHYADYFDDVLQAAIQNPVPLATADNGAPVSV